MKVIALGTYLTALAPHKSGTAFSKLSIHIVFDATMSEFESVEITQYGKEGRHSTNKL